MFEDIRDEGNYLPTKDFFDFPLYEVPAAPESRGSAQATWAVLTLPFERESPVGEMLQKLLQAAGIEGGIEGAQLTQIEPTGALSLSDCLNPQIKRCLIFGRNAPSLGWAFDVPLYQPIRRPSCTIIFADSLPVLQNDPAKKKALWQTLQQIM